MYSPWPPLYTNRTLIILAKPSPWRSLHHKGTRRCMWIPPQRPGEALSPLQARKIAHLSLTAAVTLKREYEAVKEHGSESSQSSISYISYTNKALSLSLVDSLCIPHTQATARNPYLTSQANWFTCWGRKHSTKEFCLLQ